VRTADLLSRRGLKPSPHSTALRGIAKEIGIFAIP
jgi:hypothetical protein